jgi:acyl-CoA synthetase (NDP forming)
LETLWAARSIAVIGASNRAGAPGRRPVEFMQRYGFTGRIVPVNPNTPDILGIPAVKSLREATGPIDLAMIMVPAAAVPGALDDCAAAGVRTAIVCSSGFAETGADGAELQDKIVDIARTAGIRLLGPNCIGTLGAPG